MAISASDVKRLREETDAPMMECKVALEEAGGDFEKAKAILREKGQSAAAKRSGRSTSEGVAKFVVSADGKTAVGVVLESETDFVSNNDGFRKLVDTLANGLLSAPADAVNGDVNNVSIDGKTVAELVTEGVALFRENIQLTQAVKLETDGAIGVYNHHTGKQAAVVMVSGDAANAGEVATKGAIQAVAMGATYLTKAEVPQDIIAQEMELETQRAINDGKFCWSSRSWKTKASPPPSSSRKWRRARPKSPASSDSRSEAKSHGRPCLQTHSLEAKRGSPGG
jgi:elongation factor Ts